MPDHKKITVAPSIYSSMEYMDAPSIPKNINN